jgi:Zn-dependent protease
VETLQTVLFVAPVLLFSVIAHEYAHGYAALKQGDTTAQQLGRLTWNPIKHIDPFLTILMPLMLGWMSNGRTILGGAKPVPVNPNNYRHYKRGDIIVSLAGVATNLGLAFVFAIVAVILGMVASVFAVTEPGVGILQVMMMTGLQLNLLLVVFNLLPIPPLDGSHVAKYLLPPALAAQYQRLGFLGLIILVVIMQMAPGFLTWWFTPATYLSRQMYGVVRRWLTPAYFHWMS